MQCRVARLGVEPEVHEFRPTTDFGSFDKRRCGPIPSTSYSSAKKQLDLAVQYFHQTTAGTMDFEDAQSVDRTKKE